MAEDRYLDPTRDSFDAFKALPRDVPIQMLNLLRFHESAQYPADHPNAGKGWSGARAYQEYGKTSGPIFERPVTRTAVRSWKWSPIPTIRRRWSTGRRRC